MGKNKRKPGLVDQLSKNRFFWDCFDRGAGFVQSDLSNLEAETGFESFSGMTSWDVLKKQKFQERYVNFVLAPMKACFGNRLLGILGKVWRKQFLKKLFLAHNPL